jgi:pyruvate dehydrogenase E2 component (dihydrolipoamide acetyltransferase)
MAQRWETLDDYSTWRKIAMGLWSEPDDPTIYGKETVDVSNLTTYLDEVTEASGTKVTMTAYTAKLMADILADHPDLNCMAIGDHIVQRETIDIFCQVAIPNETAGKADLSGVKLREADELSLVEIAELLRNRASDVRDGRDDEMEGDKDRLGWLPNSVLSKLLDVIDFLTYRVPIDLDALGVRSDPFGSCMVTSVGQFDIYQGFAPLLPGSHVPLIALPGKVHRASFVEDDEVVIRDAVEMSCTFDHRVYDGLQIGHVVRGMRARLMNPRDFYPEPSTWTDDESGAEADRTDATTDRTAEPREEKAAAQ